MIKLKKKKTTIKEVHRFLVCLNDEMLSNLLTYCGEVSKQWYATLLDWITKTSPFRTNLDFSKKIKVWIATFPEV